MALEHRRLGRTGLYVSAFGLGCGNFGGVGSAPEFFGMGESEVEAFALLDRAVDLGINFLDTADAYGGGRSEAIIGKWLAGKDSGLRERLLISSKVGNPVGADLNQRGLSRRHILRQIDASLTRLGVEHLDMYLVHAPDPHTPLEETVEALDSVIRAGKVRYVGVSNFPAWMTMKALSISAVGSLHRFEWVQNSFNLVDQAEQAETLEMCRDQGLGFTPFSPLCGGLLTGKYAFGEEYPAGSRMATRPEGYLPYWTEQTFAAIDRLGEAAADRGVSTAGLALAWIARHPDVTAAIVGPRRPEHFQPMEEAMQIDLSPSELAELGRLFAPKS